MTTIPDQTLPDQTLAIDFSPVIGGPLYRLYLRARLLGPAFELMRRRIVFLAMFTWLPLLLLSVLGGQLTDHAQLGFLQDIETHVRFLVVVPLLIFAEVVVHERIVPVVRRFVERRLVIGDDVARFNAAITWAIRLRDSVVLEIALVAFVWTAGLWIWRHQTANLGDTWYGFSDASGLRLRPAGYWNVFVATPILQLLLLRWYLRLAIWFLFLWRVSRLNLNLTPAHPDRSGGLGFLGLSVYAFTPVLFAQGAIVCGSIANNVLFEGDNLLNYKVLVVTFVGIFVAILLGPLTMFTPQLARVRRRGLRQYGDLASDYAAQFDQKWLNAGARREELLGTPDIRSLADIGNSYATLLEMRFVPFGTKDIVRLAATAAAPLLPLLLLVMPLEEMLVRILKMFL